MFPLPARGVARDPDITNLSNLEYASWCFKIGSVSCRCLHLFENSRKRKTLVLRSSRKVTSSEQLGVTIETTDIKTFLTFFVRSLSPSLLPHPILPPSFSPPPHPERTPTLQTPPTTPQPLPVLLTGSRQPFKNAPNGGKM